MSSSRIISATQSILPPASNPSPVRATFSSPLRRRDLGHSRAPRFQELGTKKLKNIDDPVHVHRAFLPSYELLLETAQADLKTPPRLLKHLRKPTLQA